VITRAQSKIKVHDPFSAAADAALPTVARALDPVAVKEAFKRGLPRLSGDRGQVIVKSIRVMRHKPGKRAVIEYDVRVEQGGVRTSKAVLIGKIRARRFGNEGFRLQQLLWDAGFQDDSQDHVSVPEAIGVLPDFRMWLQRKITGTVASELLHGNNGVELGRRIADAIHKLHCANMPADRSHTMADEVRILRECLAKVSAARAEWKPRLDRVMTACDRLGASVPATEPCGIHRDFYPAQVIVKRSRLFLIDFDLYCLGDPALDVGNFIGHMTEESLRAHGDATALRDCEDALENRFLELSGEALRPALRAYTTLTLVRHIYLSTQFLERAHVTEQLIELCEQRLSLAR
jgi:thiamine kinase-like enzyme